MTLIIKYPLSGLIGEYPHSFIGIQRQYAGYYTAWETIQNNLT
jgi:hypothetical protein